LFVCMALAGCAPLGAARSVTLEVDGETRQVTTETVTVGALLQERNVRLDADDRVTPAEPTLLRNGMTVRVTRVETLVQTEEREVPYNRRTVHDASVPVGETQLLEASRWNGISGARSRSANPARR